MSPSHEPKPINSPLGFVSLIGAGPGSPDLLTLRGLRALEQAQVVLFDALLEPSFAELFPKDAEAIPVGKRCGGLGTSQERIFELLLEHANAGKRVARLKGGDPLLFGRGGEEAQILEAAGIAFELIPGVSALQGAASASGIPLTHRGVSREVRILEGHHLLESDTDWHELASSRATLAIFMGTRTLRYIAKRMLDHGAPPDLPVAVIENATCADQATTISVLRLAAEGHLCSRTDGPGLVYIGAAIGERVHPTLPQFLDVNPNDALASLPQFAKQARAAGGGRNRRAG